MSFHLNRIFEIAQNLKHGNIFSYISTYSLNQVGTPINMVYGSLPLYIIAILVCFISNPIVAVYLGIWVLIAISLILNYWVALKYWKKDKLKALLFTFVYVISVYNFNSIFHAFDLGQSFSLIFLPLIAYGTYSIFFTEKSEWYLLAIGMTAVVYTHILSTLLYSTVVAVITIIGLYKSSHRLKNILNLLYAILATLLCTSFFWITFIKALTSTKLSVTMDISVAFANLSAGNFLLSTLDNMSITGLGLIIVIPTLIGLLSWKKITSIQKFTAIAGIIYCLIATNEFNVVWNFLDMTPFRSIQWPSRFVTIGFFFLAVFSTEIIAQLIRHDEEHIKLRYSLVIALVLFLTLSSSYSFVNSSKNAKAIDFTPTVKHTLPFQNYRIPDTKGFTRIVSGYNAGVGSIDYWPIKSIKKNEDIRNHMAILGKKKRKVTPTSIPNGVVYHVTANKNNQEIDLPFLSYFKYKLTVNGTNTNYSVSNRGTIATKLPKGNSTVKIQYKPDMSILIAQYFSLAMSLLLIVFSILNKQSPDKKH